MNQLINCRGCAKEIHYTAKACPNCGATNPLAGQGKNKIAAGLLALFLGCWGIHKFYLGKPGMGILYILCTFPGALLFGIPTLIIWIVSLVEGIMYLCSSDEAFSMKYDKPIKFYPQSMYKPTKPETKEKSLLD